MGCREQGGGGAAIRGLNHARSTLEKGGHHLWERKEDRSGDLQSGAPLQLLQILLAPCTTTPNDAQRPAQQVQGLQQLPKPAPSSSQCGNWNPGAAGRECAPLRQAFRLGKKYKSRAYHAVPSLW